MSSRKRSVSALEAENMSLRERISELEQQLTARNSAHFTETATDYLHLLFRLFEHAPFCVQIFDSSGVSLWMNEKMRALLGLPSSDYGVGEFNILTDPLMVSSGRADDYRRALAGEIVRSTSNVVNLDNPYNRWPTDRHAAILDQMIFPMCDASNSVVGLVYCGIDVTAVKLAETELKHVHFLIEQSVEQRTAELTSEIAQLKEELQARRAVESDLRESEAKFRAVWDAATDAMAISDPEGNVVMTNPAYQRLYGYSREQVIGKPFTIIFPPEQRDSSLQQYREMFDSLPDSLQVESVTQRADGQRQYVASHASFLTQRGKRIAMLSVIRDVTEQRRALEAKRLESIGLLAGGIAHDFNNLLTNILGNAELVLMESPLIDTIALSAREIKSAAERAAELTNQLLAYAGKGQLLRRPVNLNAVIRAMNEVLRLSARQRCRVRYDLFEPLPTIQADTSQLRQVIVNIVLNAAEATDHPHKTVTITTSVEELHDDMLSGLIFGTEATSGPFVRLSIADQGSGMDAQTLTQIFEPFFSTRFIGRGLGLAAVQGIVRRHSGVIRVQSVVDRGTRFDIWFPAQVVAVTPRASTGADASKGTVLIVDDDEAVCAVASRILQQTGYTTRTAIDGVEALEMLEAGIANLVGIVIDLTMPGMSGNELADIIRQRWPSLPTLLMSGYSVGEVARQNPNIHQDRLLQKPFTRAALEHAVETMLKLS